VRGDLLCKLGRFAEARAAFEIAAGLAANKRERELLKRRAAEAADAESRSLISNERTHPTHVGIVAFTATTVLGDS
jgi:hypothetical protein